MCWENAFVGFGANLGNPIGQIRLALQALFANPGLDHVRTSSLYRTEPVDYAEQDWFTNGVVWIRAQLNPSELHTLLLRVEAQLGRVRTVPNAPRLIDLDLLLFGDRIVDSPSLTVPHPKMHTRRFVLVPLCEIASEVEHPVLRKSARRLLDELTDPNVVECMGSVEEAAY